MAGCKGGEAVVWFLTLLLGWNSDVFLLLFSPLFLFIPHFFIPFYKQIFITIGPEILVKELASLGGGQRMGFLVAQLRSVSKLQQSWDEVLLKAGPDSSAGALT